MSTRTPDKKRRQHYVWRHYLDGWATDGKIWCRRDGKVFNASTQNVAHERDFYRLREMSESDLAVVKQMMIDPLAWPLRELAEGWIPHFTEVFRLKRLYEDSERKNPELETALDVAITNLEEELQARFEARAVPFLAALRNGDASIFDDDAESIDYTWFIAAQYFRTPGMLSSVLGAFKDTPSFNVEASFGLMRTIMSTNVAHALWTRRSVLRSTFLRSDGSTTFITGDQPIINTRAVEIAPGEAPESLELYYPLLPDLAVLLDFEAPAKSSERRTLKEDEIVTFNRMIVGKSYEQLYGVNRNVFERF